MAVEDGPCLRGGVDHQRVIQSRECRCCVSAQTRSKFGCPSESIVIILVTVLYTTNPTRDPYDYEACLTTHCHSSKLPPRVCQVHLRSEPPPLPPIRFPNIRYHLPLRPLTHISYFYTSTPKLTAMKNDYHVSTLKSSKPNPDQRANHKHRQHAPELPQTRPLWWYSYRHPRTTCA